MFHATIHQDEREAIRLSGACTPYDLQLLREHVLASVGSRTRVSVRVAPDLRAEFQRAFARVARRGVTLVLEP